MHHSPPADLSRGAIVIGAGAAGLATAYRLKQAGIPVAILEKSDRIATVWRGRHPQLHLNTHRRLSRLPGLKLPKSPGAFPSRDAIARYLEQYARFIGVPILFETVVSRLDRDGDGWTIETDKGPLRARHVVIATGREVVPRIPDWQGREQFCGEIVHSADFGSVERYRGKRVLVVGAGNSGSDVLNHLARIETRALHVSVRHGSVIAPTYQFGVPVQLLSPLMEMLPLAWTDRLLQFTQWARFGNLVRYGLPRAQGAATRITRQGVSPAIDNGFVAALKRGRIKVVPELCRFDSTGAVFADGRRIEPEIVIAATGYRTGLEPMLGHLGVLDANGVPLANGGTAIPHSPGLWFIGMRPTLSGYFRAASRNSAELARVIGEDLATRPAGEPVGIGLVGARA